MAASQSSITRNEHQAKYIRSKISRKAVDPIGEVISMQFDEKERFIQGVAVEDNCPIITLFTRDQLADIDKFCTNEDGVNSPFCADMTYDIGNYYVISFLYVCMVNTIYLLSFVDTPRKFQLDLKPSNKVRGVSTKLNKYNYYVVVTTYRHLQLVSRENAKEPILIGPVMICDVTQSLTNC